MSAMSRPVQAQKVCGRCQQLLIAGQVKLVPGRGIFCTFCAPDEKKEQVNQKWTHYWLKCSIWSVTGVILQCLFWYLVTQEVIPSSLAGVEGILTPVYLLGMVAVFITEKEVEEKEISQVGGR